MSFIGTISVTLIFCIISPNSVAFVANYVKVVD